jgi:hypothetical protein
LCKDAEKRKKERLLAKEEEEATTKALMKERKEKEAEENRERAAAAMESRREASDNFNALREEKDAYGWQGPEGQHRSEQLPTARWDDPAADRKALREAKLQLLAEKREAKEALAAAESLRRGATQSIRSNTVASGSLPSAPWRWQKGPSAD